MAILPGGPGWYDAATLVDANAMVRFTEGAGTRPWGPDTDAGASAILRFTQGLGANPWGPLAVSHRHAWEPTS